MIDEQDKLRNDLLNIAKRMDMNHLRQSKAWLETIMEARCTKCKGEKCHYEKDPY
jgi:hypothetical protein